MRFTLFFILLFSLKGLNAQLHNRLIKFNVGMTTEEFAHKADIKAHNDTSDIKFEFVSKSPSLSYTHEYVFSNILSVSGKIGGQYMNIFFNDQHYGSPYIFASINPALSLIYRGNFEYYIKLQLGASYWFNTPELLPDISRRVFPENANVFTGVTFAGINYYVSDKLGLNLELSVWSPELVSFGLSYRYYKGGIPSIQEMQDL